MFWGIPFIVVSLFFLLLLSWMSYNLFFNFERNYLLELFYELRREADKIDDSQINEKVFRIENLIQEFNFNFNFNVFWQSEKLMPELRVMIEDLYETLEER